MIQAQIERQRMERLALHQQRVSAARPAPAQAWEERAPELSVPEVGVPMPGAGAVARKFGAAVRASGKEPRHLFDELDMEGRCLIERTAPGSMAASLWLAVSEWGRLPVACWNTRPLPVELVERPTVRCRTRTCARCSTRSIRATTAT
jgi:hypothetical protein